MSSSLKISADTSEVKKSILDLGKQLQGLNSIKGSKMQIFSSEDKKFIKTELKKEMGLMKNKLKENREEIKKLVDAQKGLVQGSAEELENRKQILNHYKTQAKLAKQLGQTQKMSKGGGDLDKAGGGSMMTSLMNFAKMIPGLAAAATIGYAISKGMAANDQYVKGAGNRNKLKGLGEDRDSFGSADELSRVGLSEDDMIQRRIDATSVLGREGVTDKGEMQKAGFERAYGLEGGTMTGIATQMRGQMGGAGATDAQQKLQASVMAAGIEDAVGPYLESAVQLLTSINENGTTNTGEITALMAQLTKDGGRTPEQLSKQFGDINAGVKGASGESSAFLQQAFARAGIGGGTIGGTKFAMSSGGIMGQDRGALEKRGYNKDLLDNMDKNGMFEGAGKRTGAVLDMMKSAGGMKAGEKIGDIKDTDRMVGMGNLASNTLGIKDPSQAFDALMMMEKVQNKQMSKKQFDSKMKDMQENNDPAVARLSKINNTLSGQTTILRSINDTLMTGLGKSAVHYGNAAVKADNAGIEGVTDVSGMGEGAADAAGNGASAAGVWRKAGVLGGAAYTGVDKIKSLWGGSDQQKMDSATSDDSIVALAKQRAHANGGKFGGQQMSDEQIENKVRATLAAQAKDIGKAIGENVKIGGATVNVKNQVPGPGVTDRTTK